MEVGKAGVPLGQLPGTADVHEGHLSFPTLLSNHSMPPPVNHLPESQMPPQEHGDRLVGHSPADPSYFEAELKIFL